MQPGRRRVTGQQAVAFVKSLAGTNGNTAQLTAKRTILLVPPFDAIDSYWNTGKTHTHVTDAVYERFHDKFEALVKNEIEIWLRFHEYWLHECFQCSFFYLRA
jgi:hypothetical protein